jgi:hypothetical protein
MIASSESARENTSAMMQVTNAVATESIESPAHNGHTIHVSREDVIVGN